MLDLWSLKDLHTETHSKQILSMIHRSLAEYTIVRGKESEFCTVGLRLSSLSLWSLAKVGGLHLVAINQLQIPPTTLFANGALPDLKFCVICDTRTFGHEHHLVVVLSKSQYSNCKTLSKDPVVGHHWSKHTTATILQSKSVLLARFLLEIEEALMVLTSKHRCHCASAQCVPSAAVVRWRIACQLQMCLLGALCHLWSILILETHRAALVDLPA